jgi:two-component system chemotaxis response regulator CheB
LKTLIPSAIVIGASAGALDALSVILPALPSGFPCPVMVVVHLPADKKSIFTELLKSKCALSVKEAEDKEPIKAGTIYFAPPDYHLLVEKNGYLSLSSEEPVLFSRPSIDVLFESACDVYGETLAGIVLSGANSDGSKGLNAIAQCGGTVIVQDPQTAYATAMPMAAIAACPDAKVLSLAEIAIYLKRLI